VNQCINKEVERVKSNLLESTKLLLIKRVEGVLIHDYQHVISREINALLDNNKQSGKSFSSYYIYVFRIIRFRISRSIYIN
jgi:hypothetical protein